VEVAYWGAQRPEEYGNGPLEWLNILAKTKADIVVVGVFGKGRITERF